MSEKLEENVVVYPLGAVVSDIDGTIVDHTSGVVGTVPDSFVKAYRRLTEELQVPVHVATGRSYDSAKRLFETLGIADSVKLLPGVFSDGRVIKLDEGETPAYHCVMDHISVRLISVFLRDLRLPLGDDWGFAYMTRRGLFKFRGDEIPMIDTLARAWGETITEIDSVEEIWNFHALEVIFVSLFGSTLALNAVRESLWADCPITELFAVHDYEPWMKAIAVRGSNKSFGVRRLCHLLGYTQDEVLVIGDSYNDLELLRDFNFSIAMGNAPSSVKAEARIQTDSVAQDGWAKGVLGMLVASPPSTTFSLSSENSDN